MMFRSREVAGMGEDLCIFHSGSSHLADSAVTLELSELWENVGWCAVMKKGKVALSCQGHCRDTTALWLSTDVCCRLLLSLWWEWAQPASVP